MVGASSPIVNTERNNIVLFLCPSLWQCSRSATSGLQFQQTTGMISVKFILFEKGVPLLFITWLLQVNVPRVIQRLINALSLQEPQSKFVNETGKKSKNLSTAKKSFSPQVSEDSLCS